MWSFLAYALPLACRAALSPRPALEDLLASLVPLVVAAPTLLLPRWIADETREHVWRHALYTLAFASNYACVHWHAAPDALRWYLGLGTASLAWFTLSHVLENSKVAPLRTHHGDVAVLPLTLIAIATFASAVPDDAFRWSRSVVYVIPATVGWSTLLFCAFFRFATRRVTTHADVGFEFVARAALVLAGGHLALLELNADPRAWLVHPLVGAVLLQTMPPPDAAPVVRGAAAGGGVGAALGALVGLALQGRLGPDAPGVLAAACGVATLTVRPVAAERWVGPASAYVALLGGALLVARGHVPGLGTLDAADVVLLATGAALALGIAAYVAPAIRPRTPPPPLGPYAAPQLRSPGTWVSLGRALDVPLPRWVVPCLSSSSSSTAYDEAALRALHGAAPHPSCPRRFVGVWWMRDNPLPMDLMCVHHLAWTHGGTRATMWNARHTTRHATVSGAAAALAGALTTTALEVQDADPRWIRTDAALFFGAFARVLWIYAEPGGDTMRRVQYDAAGKNVVYEYTLVRLTTAEGALTKHARAFLRERGGARFLVR